VQLPAAAEEQQAVHRSFDHLQSDPKVRPRWLWHFEELHHRSQCGEDIAAGTPDNRQGELHLTSPAPSSNGRAFRPCLPVTNAIVSPFHPCPNQTSGIKFDHWGHSKMERTMLRKMMLAALVVTFAGGAALAQETCDSKAVGKDGKPLAGAAKTSFMKKCMADTCATKAVGSDGKPLAGAAKASFMKKCEMGT
jgi:hypothetical protein